MKTKSSICQKPLPTNFSWHKMPPKQKKADFFKGYLM